LKVFNGLFRTKDKKVILTSYSDIDQVHGGANAGESFGEFGVLYCRPQRFTVQTTKISQILRLGRTSLMNAIQANVEDGHKVVNNLFQVGTILVILIEKKINIL
jgi:CRP-like cAMP-binding protein